MCVRLGTAAHGSAAACLPHFISYTSFAAQWVTLVLAAGSCPVSFVRGMLCQCHRALLIYDSTVVTDEDRLCLQMTVDDLQLWVSESLKKFRPHFFVMPHSCFSFICLS